GSLEICGTAGRGNHRYPLFQAKFGVNTMTLLEPGNNSPSAWRDEMPVTNRYTFGVAGERFFRAIKDE
ncbi:MAG TPA: hypothetical protein VMW34_14580, partial [Anaerolineales bacterium]|nr:hypothetical protein [Anaerolineales bacterium]